MKRKDAEPIGKLIQQYLRRESLDSPLNERRLINSWAQLMGKTTASLTQDIYIRNQTLYVKLTSSTLRQELMMAKDFIVRRLNDNVGATVITNIVFC